LTAVPLARLDGSASNGGPFDGVDGQFRVTEQLNRPGMKDEESVGPGTSSNGSGNAPAPV